MIPTRELQSLLKSGVNMQKHTNPSNTFCHLLRKLSTMEFAMSLIDGSIRYNFGIWENYFAFSITLITPMTVAARSKALSVFSPPSTVIVGSNPIRDMYVCVRLFCICVVLCVGSDLTMDWSPVQAVISTVYRLSMYVCMYIVGEGFKRP
jgi:cellulose synthase/poly-beta-1,6-N-acetylglucosamine synthase-like glycosyltransferase